MVVDVRLDKIYSYPDYLVEVETVKADLTQYRDSPEKLDAFFKGYSLLLFGVCPDVERVYYYVPAFDYVTGMTRDKLGV